MQFSSATFLILFLPGIMLIYYLGRKHLAYKNAVLLLGSLFFYAWGEPLFVFVMCGSIVVNYFLGMLLSGRRYRKAVLVTSVLFNLGILFVFKYLSFVTEVLSDFANIKICHIALPIGISFFTFQIMSYIFDVYYGNAKIQKNIVSLALYITMFPQLVAGPIVRYQSVEYRINKRHETLLDFEYGIRRFAVGLSKKVLLADFLGAVVERIFGEIENLNGMAGATAWLGAIAYTLEIYYDFSGYSDMAIGLGRCFGFHFNENFKYPYTAESITEFWKRWHISLTDWFRDYVYIPLGGNRVSTKRHIRNLLVVWTLTGIWHGANWTFLIWGLIYFVFQVMEKYLYDVKKAPCFLRHTYTLLIVMINWVVFRSSNLTCAVRYLKSMFFGWAEFWDEKFIVYMKNSAVILICAMIGCLPIKKIVRERFPSLKNCIIVNSMMELGLAALFILSVLISVNGMYSPFIYFNF